MKDDCQNYCKPSTLQECVALLTYILDDHDKEWQLNAESLVGISRASDVVSGYIGAHYFEH